MKSGAPVLYPNDTVAKAVSEYSEAHSLRLPPHILAYHAHIQETQSSSNYMISTSQSQSLVFLARLIDAKRVLEIGVYVGFSALVWSHAVGPAGTVTGLEFNAAYAQQALDAFRAHDVRNVEILVGDAMQTLTTLGKDKPVALPYDVVFIDAQKAGYPHYLATILARSPPGAAPADRLLRAGGLIVADNVLRRGLVADDSAANPHAEQARERAARSEYAADDDVPKMREFNAMVSACDRLENFLLPLWDGANLVRLID